MLKAFAEPRRQDILRVLSDKEMAAGEIAGHFNVSRPAISQHLQVLKAAGLIIERRWGTSRLYHVRPEAIAELKAFLEAFWDDALGRLAEAVQKEQGLRTSRPAQPTQADRES